MKQTLALMVSRREADRLIRWLKCYAPASVKRCEIEWEGSPRMAVNLIGEPESDDAAWCCGFACAFLNRNKFPVDQQTVSVD